MIFAVARVGYEWLTRTFSGHYVYEGLVVVVFDNDMRPVYANEGSDYYHFLGCAEYPCPYGSVSQYIDFFFGGKFSDAHITRNAFILGGALIVARLTTYFALRYLKFTAT